MPRQLRSSKTSSRGRRQATSTRPYTRRQAPSTRPYTRSTQRDTPQQLPREGYALVNY